MILFKSSSYNSWKLSWPHFCEITYSTETSYHFSLLHFLYTFSHYHQESSTTYITTKLHYQTICFIKPPLLFPSFLIVLFSCFVNVNGQISILMVTFLGWYGRSYSPSAWLADQLTYSHCNDTTGNKKKLLSNVR